MTQDYLAEKCKSKSPASESKNMKTANSGKPVNKSAARESVRDSNDLRQELNNSGRKCVSDTTNASNKSKQHLDVSKNAFSYNGKRERTPSIKRKISDDAVTPPTKKFLTIKQQIKSAEKEQVSDQRKRAGELLDALQRRKQEKAKLQSIDLTSNEKVDRIDFTKGDNLENRICPTKVTSPSVNCGDVSASRKANLPRNSVCTKEPEDTNQWLNTSLGTPNQKNKTKHNRSFDSNNFVSSAAKVSARDLLSSDDNDDIVDGLNRAVTKGRCNSKGHGGTSRGRGRGRGMGN